MQVIDIHHLSGVNYHKKTKRMGDLKINFDKILPIVKEALTDQLEDDGNLQFYPNNPTMPDAPIISLSLLQETLPIDSERRFWSKLQADYGQALPYLPHLTRYNRRRKRLAEWIEKLFWLWGRQICPNEDTYMGDSIPVPVAYIVREHSTRVCCERFYSAQDKGYSAITDQYYIGYKMHLVVSLDGVYQSMDMTKASVHDIHYLKDIKQSGLSNCLLSASQEIDLFFSAGIELQTPMHCNQKDYRPRPKVFKTARRRVETVFSQLCDQWRESVSMPRA